MTFDTLYNFGQPYWTVVGIRFNLIVYAYAYAQTKADERGFPINVIQYDKDHPNGAIITTTQPDETDHEDE
jgi:hypothetical protein